MRWAHHNELSESDLKLLVGSTVIVELMRNKLVVKYHDDDEYTATPREMGLHKCEGLYFMRYIEQNKKLVEIQFELPRDRDMVEENLTQYKLAL